MSLFRNWFWSDAFEDDARLVQALIDRSDEAVTELYRRVRGPVYRIIKQDGSHPKHIVDDVIQDGLLILYEKLEKGEYEPKPDARFHSFFIQICKYVWLNVKSKEDRRKTLAQASVGTQDGPVESFIQELAKEQEALLAELMAKMGETCRKILTLFYFYNQSFAEIEPALNFAPNTGRQKKDRCLKKLWKAFKAADK